MLHFTLTAYSLVKVARKKRIGTTYIKIEATKNVT